jgi:hypothetical protein
MAKIAKPQSPKVLISSVQFSTRRGFSFLPGLMLIALGVVVIAAPRLVMWTVALFLLSLGALLCYLTYKILMVKRQLNRFAKSFEDSVMAGFKDGAVFRSGSASEGDLFSDNLASDKPDIDITDLNETGGKKIVFH